MTFGGAAGSYCSLCLQNHTSSVISASVRRGFKCSTHVRREKTADLASVAVTLNFVFFRKSFERIQVETQIPLQFQHATLRDLLLPAKKESSGNLVFLNELESTERILKLFLSRFRGYDDGQVSDMPMLSGVAKLWDDYLPEIAVDSSVTLARFADLLEQIPADLRVLQDHVYRAIYTYLKAHGSIDTSNSSSLEGWLRSRGLHRSDESSSSTRLLQ